MLPKKNHRRKPFSMKLRRQFAKFVMVGLLCSTLNLLMLYVLISYFNINYILSTLIALLSINFLGFYLNKYYTFQTSKRKFWKELWKYYSVMFSSFLLNLFFMYVLVGVFKMWYIYASLTITIGFLFYNFLMHKSWSFR
jgi:putative flippase GtrA